MVSLHSWSSGLRAKLLILVLAPAATLAGIVTYASHRLQVDDDQLATANLKRAPLISYSGNLVSAMNGIPRWLWSAYASMDFKERDAALKLANAEREDFVFNQKEYLVLSTHPKMQLLFKPVEVNWARYNQAVTDTIALLDKHDAKSDEMAKAVMHERVHPIGAMISLALSNVRQARLETMKSDNQHDAEESKNATFSMRWAGILAGLGVLGFGIAIASRLARLLTQVSDQISESGIQLGSASQQLSAASHQVSAGTTESASSLEETVASIEELSSMVKVNSDNAQQTSGLADHSTQAAQAGESEIRSLIVSMNELSTSSNKIKDIITVIDDIAFQTNLLALNAAVEAARAGEHGKGFAVVAEAVRTLAQRSSVAAKDITSLIQESVSQIELGGKKADQSGNALREIVITIQKVADLSREISSASKEQATGISQISKAMNQLDISTQQNAAASEEVATSAEEVSSQAYLFGELFQDLQTLIQGRVRSASGGSGTPLTRASNESAPRGFRENSRSRPASTQRPRAA